MKFEIEYKQNSQVVCLLIANHDNVQVQFCIIALEPVPGREWD